MLLPISIGGRLSPHPSDRCFPMTCSERVHGERDPLFSAETDRRRFLIFGLGLFAVGCASPQRTAGLPGVIWPKDEPIVAERPSSSSTGHTPSPTSSGSGSATGVNEFPGVLGRDQWAKGAPAPELMDRLGGVRYITIHHDGMNPFYGDDAGAAADRIELIRRSHRGKGWGDIGYHFVVDRGGRVWQARSLSYQGAHVKDYNELNIGIMALGNFDIQSPTDAQITALSRHVNAVMNRYRVSASNVRSHQEWSATACPGRNMQGRFVTLRTRSFAA